MSIEVTLRELSKPGGHPEQQRRKLAALPDEKIWQLLREGNEMAYEIIYRRNEERLFHYGMKIVRDEDLVNDTLQDLFVHLWENKSGLSGIQYIKPYLFRALRNNLLRKASGQQKILHLIDDDNGSGVLDQYSIEDNAFREEEYMAVKRKLRKAISTLPRKQQELLHLRFYDGLTSKEISGVTGINKRTVNYHLSQALKKLHEIGGDLFFFVLMSGNTFRKMVD